MVRIAFVEREETKFLQSWCEHLWVLCNVTMERRCSSLQVTNNEERRRSQIDTWAVCDGKIKDSVEIGVVFRLFSA
jgi:hypothetical protein